MGIGVIIDQHIAQDCDKRIISVGDTVKAMVLNGLGFVKGWLYLVPSFFENKPTERLIKPPPRVGWQVPSPARERRYRLSGSAACTLRPISSVEVPQHQRLCA